MRMMMSDEVFQTQAVHFVHSAIVGFLAIVVLQYVYTDGLKFVR